MIGWKNSHDRIWVFMSDVNRSQADARSRVASAWLNEHRASVKGGQMSADGLHMMLAGNNSNPMRWDEGGQMFNGFNDERRVCSNRQKLLRSMTP
jgi:hypothetical protein